MEMLQIITKVTLRSSFSMEEVSYSTLSKGNIFGSIWDIFPKENARARARKSVLKEYLMMVNLRMISNMVKDWRS